MNNIITISGDPGSGKSTTIQELKKIFLSQGKEVIVYETGKVFRELARKQGKSIVEFNDFLEKNGCGVDESIDNAVREIGEKIQSNHDDNKVYIIDSRLAWHSIPKSLKVRLTTTDFVAAQRIFNDSSRNEGEKYSTLDEAISSVKRRKEEEVKRYISKYGENVDISDDENFDIVINTTAVKPEEVASCILKSYGKGKNGKQVPKRWASPKMFLPMQSIRDTEEEKLNYLKKDMKKNGYNPNEPICGLQVEDRLFLADGHHRCMAAIIDDIPLIPYYLGAKNDELYFAGRKTARQFTSNYMEYFYPSMLYDFEDLTQKKVLYGLIYPGLCELPIGYKKEEESR